LKSTETRAGGGAGPYRHPISAISAR